MEIRALHTIKPHPLNAALYADAADSDLLESIRKIGIQSPILITQDGLIISGHRRFNAAQMLQLSTVPVNVSSLTDPLDIEEALIETNRQRQKTTEQMAREFQRLKEIEGEKARRRQATKSQLPPNLAEVEKGEAREIAAKKVGFNGHTQAEKAEKVVSTIDKLQQRGEVDQAQALRTTLNEKSVHAAYQAAREIDPPAHKPAPPALELPQAQPDPEVQAFMAEWEEPSAPEPVNKLAALMSSESPEHYTPTEIWQTAAACLGGIDLDPCSNSKESPNVQALRYFTRDDDGLAQEWGGKVFMNPPYGDEIKAWVIKLRQEYDAGRVTEAIALVPARTDTAWFQLLAGEYFPFCNVIGRLKFIGNTQSAPFPSTIFYLGENVGAFYRHFSEFGHIFQRVHRDMVTE